MSEPDRIEIATPRLRIAALSWGPADGALALCLHGYPDTAWTFRHLGPRLAAEGWRVVAPFARGYAPTEIPADGAYQVGALARDALDVARALGDERAVMIGHDWGALAAYTAAAVEPARFRRVVTLAVPPFRVTVKHPGAALRNAPKSWYITFQQIPVLAERSLDRVIPLLWRRWSPGYDATVDLGHLWDALPSRAHRTAALGYYKHLLQPWRHRREYRGTQQHWLAVPPQPTLYLHGGRDGCVRAAVVDLARPLLAPGSRAERLPGCGHFLHLEQPETVHAAIAEFLGE